MRKNLMRQIPVVFTLVLIMVLGMLSQGGVTYADEISLDGENSAQDDGIIASAEISLIVEIKDIPDEINTQIVSVGTELENLVLPEEMTAFTEVEGVRTEIIITDMLWTSEPDYDGNVSGIYVFTALLPEGYELAPEVVLPEITVNVESDSPSFPKEDKRGENSDDEGSENSDEDTPNSFLVEIREISDEIKTQTVLTGTEFIALNLPKELVAFIAAEEEKIEITVTDVTWMSEPDYDRNVAGTYVFTVVLPDGYELVSEAVLPKITVNVETAVQGLLLEEEEIIAEFVGFTDGDGTAEFPYEVTTAEELDKVRNLPYAHFIQTADIDLSGMIWAPIGDDNNFFTGTYDGNDHTISNLTIQNDDCRCGGLFGDVAKNGVLKNIELIDVKVISNYDYTDSDNWARVGGLIGSNEGKVLNCSGNGKISAGTYADVGGLIGENYGEVNNCFSECAVNGGSGAYIGGLVGYNDGIISSCYSIDVAEGSEEAIVGGLVGYNDVNGDISCCYSVGNVLTEDATDSAFAAAGGLIGFNVNSTVSNSYSTGSVTGGTSAAVGGFIGYNENSTVSNSYSAGSIIENEDVVEGGLIGLENKGNVISSYYLGDATEDDTALTEAKMKQQASFIGWDFANVWKIGEGKTYPTLYWQPWSAEERITADISALSWTEIKGLNDTPDQVREDLNLPLSGAKGSEITWSVDKAGFINTTTGAVTGPNGESETVTLMASVSYREGEPLTKEFALVIIGLEDYEYFSVTYAANGGTGTAPTESDKVAGAVFAAATNSLTAPTGMRFKEWNTASDGTDSGYAAGEMITMPDKNLILYAIWERKPSLSGGGGGASYSPPLKSEPQGIFTNEPELNEATGVVEGEINSYFLEKAFESAVQNNDANKIQIIIPTESRATGYQLTLPYNILISSDTDTQLKIKTDIATVTLPGNMLNQEEETVNDNVSLTISRVEETEIADEEIRKQIEERPLIQLTLALDGRQTNWHNPVAPVTVSIPYTPTAEELKNFEHITVWYIDGSGKVVSVPNGSYDPETGTVTFSTSHFSYYAVVYVDKTFNDLSSVEWARKSIKVLASKGIINGTGSNNFSPTANITRADYLVLLVKTLGLTAEIDGNFADISTDDYYYQEIGIAKKLGIASGMGDNRFMPNVSITRQDMMVMTERALRMQKKLEAKGSAADLEKFNDKSLVAAYAVNGVATLVKEGLIVGIGDNINPLGNTTRAEAAAILYRIYKQLY